MVIMKENEYIEISKSIYLWRQDPPFKVRTLFQGHILTVLVFKIQATSCSMELIIINPREFDLNVYVHRPKKQASFPFAIILQNPPHFNTVPKTSMS